jgi:hypothetical protein
VESIDEDWSIACGEWAAYGLWPDNNLSIRIIFVTQNLWYSREYRGIPLAPPLLAAKREYRVSGVDR